jgi:hypothetical protein
MFLLPESWISGKGRRQRDAIAIRNPGDKNCLLPPALVFGSGSHLIIRILDETFLNKYVNILNVPMSIFTDQGE